MLHTFFQKNKNKKIKCYSIELQFYKLMNNNKMVHYVLKARTNYSKTKKNKIK